MFSNKQNRTCIIFDKRIIFIQLASANQYAYVRCKMLPLIAADINEDLIVRKVGGNPEIKLHLQDLGIVPGQIISLISVNDGNVIVKVKESRLAINKDMAMKIMI